MYDIKITNEMQRNIMDTAKTTWSNNILIPMNGRSSARRVDIALSQSNMSVGITQMQSAHRMPDISPRPIPQYEVIISRSYIRGLENKLNKNIISKTFIKIINRLSRIVNIALVPIEIDHELYIYAMSNGLPVPSNTWAGETREIDIYIKEK